MATAIEVKALADAMWQLLDDMRDGKCVCGLAKAQARLAFEPFIALAEADDAMEDIMPLGEARRIVHECNG